MASKHTKVKAARATPPPAHIEPAELHPQHTAPSAIARYAAEFAAGTPFPHLCVRDVLPDALLLAVRDEILAGPLFAKRNDLYDFAQSDALRLSASPATRALCATLYSPAFRAWISAVTGIETDPTVDISAAVYGPGAHLLCHDDDLESRRIAFILYLVPQARGLMMGKGGGRIAFILYLVPQARGSTVGRGGGPLPRPPGAWFDGGEGRGSSTSSRRRVV